MRKRDTPLAAPPDEHPYLTIVRGDGEGITLRAISEARYKRISATLNGEPELRGALIGYAWADPVYELETKRPNLRTGDLYEYGDAVEEELHLAGLLSHEIFMLHAALADQFLKGMDAPKEALQKLENFAHLADAGILSASTPDPTSPETPGSTSDSPPASGAT